MTLGMTTMVPISTPSLLMDDGGCLPTPSLSRWPQHLATLYWCQCASTSKYTFFYLSIFYLYLHPASPNNNDNDNAPRVPATAVASLSPSMSMPTCHHWQALFIVIFDYFSYLQDCTQLHPITMTPPQSRLWQWPVSAPACQRQCATTSKHFLLLYLI